MMKIKNHNSNNYLLLPQEYCRPKKILITGGLGDIFAIESYFPETWYTSVQKIILATRAAPFVIDFFEKKIIPFVNAQIDVIETDFTHPICDMKEFISRTNYRDTENLTDCSISKIFNLIITKKMRYKGSSIIKNLNVDISKFDLPKKFVLICPITNHDKKNPRYFDIKERREINSFLKKEGIKGVIIHNEKYEFSKEIDAIDLSGKTNVEESIEIMKKASGFISVDSAFTVLACQIFNVENILIKSSSKHYDTWIKPYTNPINST